MVLANSVIFLSVTHGHLSFIAIMLGRLCMDIDACITTFITLVRAMQDRAPSLLLSAPDPDLTWLDVAVTEMVVTYGGSSAETFIQASSAACKVLVS
jgi:hypothetical protein